MTREELVAFIRAQPCAVEATVSGANEPQCAVVGVVVTDDAELFFDTSSRSRKFQNLMRRPAIALVFGWDENGTLQLEGTADQPRGEELARLKALLFERFPEGRARQAWPDIAYVRVRPRWARFSHRRGGAIHVEELSFAHDEQA